MYLNVKCKYCNFLVAEKRLLKHEDSCRKNPKNIKTCPVCNKQHNKNKIVCSEKCSKLYYNLDEVYLLDSELEDREKYRDICFRFHKKQCIICDECNIVAVHHMNEDHSDNRAENLVPLCPTHHMYMHSKYKELIIERVEEYLILFLEGQVSVL